MLKILKNSKILKYSEKFWKTVENSENPGKFLTQKIDFESQILAFFDKMILAKNLANYDPPSEKKVHNRTDAILELHRSLVREVGYLVGNNLT